MPKFRSRWLTSNFLVRFLKPSALRASRLMRRLPPSEASSQVGVFGGVSEEAVAGGGDRGAVGGDVGAADGQSQQITQDFLGLPGRLDLPTEGTYIQLGLEEAGCVAPR